MPKGTNETADILPRKRLKAKRRKSAAGVKRTKRGRKKR